VTWTAAKGLDGPSVSVVPWQLCKGDTPSSISGCLPGGSSAGTPSESRIVPIVRLIFIRSGGRCDLCVVIACRHIDK
jgi:hypothetical protein